MATGGAVASATGGTGATDVSRGSACPHAPPTTSGTTAGTAASAAGADGTDDVTWQCSSHSAPASAGSPCEPHCTCSTAAAGARPASTGQM